MNARVATQLAGPGGAKLVELERETGKHFTVETVERMPLTEVDVVREGSRADVDGDGLPVADGDELRVKISEPHMYNTTDGVARLNGGVRGRDRWRDRLHRPGPPHPHRPRQPHRRLRDAARREDDRVRARAGAGVLLRAARDGARGRRAARAGAAHQAAQDAPDAGHEGQGRRQGRGARPTMPRPRRRPPRSPRPGAGPARRSSPKPRRPTGRRGGGDRGLRRRMRPPRTAPRQATRRRPPRRSAGAESAAGAAGRGPAAAAADGAAAADEAADVVAAEPASDPAAEAAPEAEAAQAADAGQDPGRRAGRGGARAGARAASGSPSRRLRRTASAGSRRRRRQEGRRNPRDGCWAASPARMPSGTIPRLMYAVIKVGGKQYKVEQGQTLLVDRQPHEPGKSFTPPVLMTGGDEVVTDGTKLDGAVTAQVVEHLRGEKIKVFTFKPKRGFKKTRGHRSELSRIQIDAIGPSKPKRAPAKKAADEKPAEKAAAAAGQEAGREEAAPLPRSLRPGRRRPPPRRRTSRSRRGSLAPRSPRRTPAMAHKKGLGSSKNGRDSARPAARREGVRRPDGDGRLDHRAPARHPLLPRRRRRARKRRHRLRDGRPARSSFTRRNGRRYISVLAEQSA